MNNEWDDRLLAQKLKDNPNLQIHPDSIASSRKGTKPQTGILPSPKKNKAHPERDLSQFVYDAVKAFGLLGYHTYRSKFSEPGFPDWIIIGKYQIVAELKDTGKNPTPAQQNWLDAFETVAGHAYVWRPEDKDEILRVLSKCRLK